MLIKNYKHFVKILNPHQYDDKSQVLFSHLMKYCLHQRQLQQHPLLYNSSLSSFIRLSDIISLILLLLMLPLSSRVEAVGYSYTRFVGPVTGPEHKIYVNDANDANSATNDKTSPPYLPRLDYVAKPEYEFAYGVEDADAHILHNRNEMRDGDVVKGVYSLIDPDGALRVVKYTADEMNGFQAEVIRNGVSSLHGQLQNDYNRIPPSKIINNDNHNNYYKPDHEQQLKHHYPQSHYTQTPEKVNVATNDYYPSSASSSNGYTPNWEQLQQINQQLSYDPHIQYHAPPPQPPIIYHYNNNNNVGSAADDDVEDDDDVNNSNSSSNDSDSDYHDQGQTQYEVHEKPGNDDEDEEIEEDEDDNDSHQIKNPQIISYKKKNKKGDYDEDDEDEGDDSKGDYDEDEESEEFEDYNETGHNESEEYY